MASERDMSYQRDEPLPLPWYPAHPPGGPEGPGGSRPESAARPPLTKRMRAVHWMALDVVVAFAGTLCAMFVLLAPFGTSRMSPLADLALAALIFLPVALRRRGPAGAFGVLVTVAAVVAGGAPQLSALAFLAAAYVLYLLTAVSNRRTGLAALALALVVMALIVVANKEFGDGTAGNYVPVACAMIIAWVTGYSVRQRRLYAQTLQHQAASSAVAEERLRIARELHDVVAHSMSVIAVQAGYGQYVIDSSPADARDALGAIQATSRDALEEMRRMLGVLRQQDLAAARPARAPLAPAPGLSDLDRLTMRTCGAGVQVSVARSGHVRPVPAGVDLSAYRIIQEALTNVVRHAGGGARCTVSLGYTGTALEVRVTDDGGRSLALTPAGVGARAAVRATSGVGAGHGIIGMRERANLCGGEFSASPLPEGGFQVIAKLPLLASPTVPAPAPAIPVQAAAAGTAGAGTEPDGAAR